MKLRFILNPRSGRNIRRPWLAPHIRDFITTHRLNASLVVTLRPGHATELARSALVDGCDRVVAVGGDGTMNEVAQALLNSRVALALVPCGSGNGLALHLGLPTRVDAALELAINPAAGIAEIDSGVANGHPFFNAMGSGFDADISDRFNRLERRGLPAYAKTGLAAFLRRRTERVIITGSSRRIELDTLLVAVANSDQYGNNAKIAPGARVDDGELNLVAITPIEIASVIPLMARLFSGALLGSRHVVHFKGHRIRIERSLPGLIHTDGETHDTAAVIDVVVRARSLRLVIPPQSHAMPHRIVSPAIAPETGLHAAAASN